MSLPEVAIGVGEAMTAAVKSDLRMSRPRIAVVGSINMDLVVRCSRLPKPGETILAGSAEEVCGGKGANQAVAAARAGGDVAMIGRVGNDAFAERLVTNLSECGIDTRAVSASSGFSSGIALVAVEDSGQNSIMVVPGANAWVTPEDVRNHEQAVISSDILMVQLEVPLAAVAEAIRIARDHRIPVILDPAPAPDVWPGTLAADEGNEKPLKGISVICPNESEAARLTGISVETLEDAEEAARRLHRQGAAAVAVTLAERGVLLFDGTTMQHIRPFAVNVVDTTAAGDAFAGALAVRWVESGDLAEAVRFASAAGALATTRHGAQVAMSTREEIELLLAQSES